MVMSTSNQYAPAPVGFMDKYKTALDVTVGGIIFALLFGAGNTVYQKNRAAANLGSKPTTVASASPRATPTFTPTPSVIPAYTSTPSASPSATPSALPSPAASSVSGAMHSAMTGAGAAVNYSHLPYAKTAHGQNRTETLVHIPDMFALESILKDPSKVGEVMNLQSAYPGSGDIVIPVRRFGKKTSISVNKAVVAANSYNIVKVDVRHDAPVGIDRTIYTVVDAGSVSTSTLDKLLANNAVKADNTLPAAYNPATHPLFGAYAAGSNFNPSESLESQLKGYRGFIPSFATAIGNDMSNLNDYAGLKAEKLSAVALYGSAQVSDDLRGIMNNYLTNSYDKKSNRTGNTKKATVANMKAKLAEQGLTVGSGTLNKVISQYAANKADAETVRSSGAPEVAYATVDDVVESTAVEQAPVQAAKKGFLAGLTDYRRSPVLNGLKAVYSAAKEKCQKQAAEPTYTPA